MLALIVIGILLVLGAAGAYVYFSSASGKASKGDDTGDKKSSSGSSSQGSIGPVPMEDFFSLFNQLSPDSTHFDILWAVMSMNDVLDRASNEIDKINEMREKKTKQLQEEKAKKESNQVDFDDLVNDDGWGDEGDDDDEGGDAVQKARAEDARKQEEMARLRKATGKTLPKMEGIDEGVLGQEWVEKTLEKAGAWPPKQLADSALANKTFAYKPNGGRVQQLKPMDHPAFRRCLCMTMGRLHSNLLNTHPELIKAGMNKAVDETYFKGSMEFRQRIALILDATLRIALTMQSYPLFGTLVETLAAFKIGCDPVDSKSLPWFNGTMARQYNTLPRLDIGQLSFEEAPPPAKQGEQPTPTPATPLTELVAGKSAVIVLPVDRKHAEAFTKVKLAQCQKQGIPPQIALQGYREAWWFLVRWQPTSSQVDNALEDIPRKFMDNLDAAVVQKFESTSADLRVRTAFPMMVQNIAQKSGAVKVRITAPKNPGTYKIVVAVKSSDFLGADQEQVIQIKVQEAPEEDVAVAEEDESKKEK
eukprot:CAMPEP_0172451736 /NCGR_PEP_ID=MMETSP1065-20121228/9649_1 /TAXON_ID=265537 /ORGANISM="Amphiprora paludosa, Strain CCMP125" /LENGTH=531 /DNA_ID=CAMNT_0013203707 /DNA_START=60 /DNA_END=1655 /DNA_ORIENTATION=-